MKPIKLSRDRDHRTALVKNLATSLVLYERVQTTPAKAKAAQLQTERLITLAKRWTAAEGAGQKLALYRQILAGTSDELAAKKLIEVLAGRFASRTGGYTRRLRLGRRLGDGAEQVILSLTDRDIKASVSIEAKSTKAAKKTVATEMTETK